ncbi:MAG TPA: FAD binding domain-containing protein [Soehngenia sp.]|uniref:Xanthine dehydrogenase family protein subunit M n=1 Tax=Soehngenia longivitae TaxID=2562294 RepID=A0A4Z0D776_9FIRM|nr:FAD binding domain-containing protein [Soehngenia longivitae]TFZ40725.1 xanthine dehydrogenase family protein subunit M [Soehngenia longivitae]HPP31884.1 FAD binding domain-containing protein [Soehngenia sp.]
MKVYKSNSVEETLEILKSAPKSKIISGGTDLIIELRNHNSDVDYLVDISSIEELKKIEKVNDEYIIGSAVPFSDILNFKFPDNLKGFVNALNQIGSPQIRNRGTIGGNLANASTSADSAPVLLALDAKVGISTGDFEKEVSMTDFYDFIGEGLYHGIITYIKFKEIPLNSYLSFEKLGYRKSLAISKLSISTNITLNENFEIEKIFVASGAIGKYPMREYEVESKIISQPLNENIIQLSIETMKEIISERLKGRSSLNYKLSAIEYVLRSCLEESIQYFKRC